MFSYAVKRVTRSLGLFAALLLGVVLASTFFAGVNIGADTTAKAALDQQLSRVLVDVTAARYGSTLSSANWTTAKERISSVDGVADTEAISRIDSYQESFERNYSYFRLVGIADKSRVYNGLTVTSGASVLGKSEAYLWVGSEDVDEIELDDTLIFNFTLGGYPAGNMSIPLKVAGFASLDESAYDLVSGYYGGDGGPIFVPPMRDGADVFYPGLNIILVSWDETFATLLDAIYPLQVPYGPTETQILVFLDREALIHPWDVAASQEAINRVVLQIDNQVAEFGIKAYSNLQMTLSYFTFLSLRMRANFLAVALPVFFVAWYVGTTVSDVSFNLRRREIGLLSAKGISSGQLFRLFLSESLLVGIMGSAIGVGASFLLSPYLVAAVGGELGGTAPVLTLEVIAMAVIFGTGITLLSTFRPSRRAAKLPTVDALREYTYVEETKPYKQKWPWVAFFFGGYKIVMSAIGIPNLSSRFTGGPPPTANIFLTILLTLWIVIDTVLTPIGPLVFFWGFTKIFIRGSLAFQELVTRAARFLGDLGTLATRNVRRNPARAASIAFLIAFIIGYGFQTVGLLASEDDYAVRQVQTSVGADISISLTSLANATAVQGAVAELDGVASTSVTYAFSGDDLSLVAVDPQGWLATAYYENEWFSGPPVATAFQRLAEDNYTVILEKSVASTLELDVGEFITLGMGVTTAKLKVVGFFGPESSGAMPPVYGPAQYVASRLWSFVPEGLYNTTGGGVYVSGKVLVRLDAMANGTRVAGDIRTLDLGAVDHVYSVDEQLQEREANLLLSGTQNVQRIGVVFAVVAASGATALVAVVSMQERKKELAIMNARGLSFKQLLTMLVAENLSMVVFAMALGVAVGLIIVHGMVTSLNTQYATLVAHHIVFPPDAVLILVASLMLVLASSILPVIAVTKRYISKLERIVRA